MKTSLWLKQEPMESEKLFKSKENKFSFLLADIYSCFKHKNIVNIVNISNIVN